MKESDEQRIQLKSRHNVLLMISSENFAALLDPPLDYKSMTESVVFCIDGFWVTYLFLFVSMTLQKIIDN